MTLQDYSNPGSLGSRLRRRRLAPFLAMVDVVYRGKGACNILDIGGRQSYWDIAPENFLADRRCRIVLSNIEQPQDREDAPQSPGRFEYRVEDACDLKYPDQCFDIVHSNSVIEHVGGWARMEKFAANARRVGCGYFIQTPDYWFPLEPHFGFPYFASLPRPWQVKLLMRRACGFFPRASSVEQAVRFLESCQLLDKPMMMTLFPDAQLTRERIAGLSKSLIAIKSPMPAALSAAELQEL